MVHVLVYAEPCEDEDCSDCKPGCERIRVTEKENV